MPDTNYSVAAAALQVNGGGQPIFGTPSARSALTSSAARMIVLDGAFNVADAATCFMQIFR
jgi:hypothetical protein